MRSQAKAVYVLGSCLHGWCQAFHKQQEKAPGHVMGEEVGSPQLQSGLGKYRRQLPLLPDPPGPLTLSLTGRGSGSLSMLLHYPKHESEILAAPLLVIFHYCSVKKTGGVGREESSVPREHY